MFNLQGQFQELQRKNAPFLYYYKTHFYKLSSKQLRHYHEIICEYLELAQKAAQSCNTTIAIEEFVSSFAVVTSIMRTLSEHEFTEWFNGMLPSQNYDEIIERKSLSEIDLFNRIYGKSPLKNIFEEPQYAIYESFFTDESKNYLQYGSQNGNPIRFNISENDIFSVEHFYNIPSFDPTILSHYERQIFFQVTTKAKDYKLPTEMYSVALFIAAQSLNEKMKLFFLEALFLLFEHSSNAYDYFITAIAICMGGFPIIEKAINSFSLYMNTASTKQISEVEKLFPFATFKNLKYHIAYLHFINENHEKALQCAMELNSIEDFRITVLIAKIYREIDPIMSIGYLQEVIESNDLSIENAEIIQELANSLEDIKEDRKFDLVISEKKQRFYDALHRSIQSFLIATNVLSN